MTLSTTCYFLRAVVARVTTTGVFIADRRPGTGTGVTRSARSYGSDEVSR